ncbi:hypothetical protein M408DRAFT_162605 [Serendipita vermifera MAFF 305830]|uniref:Uncharacterized protein n=1 Tax=Serendipita vermifera MAFF 305830 TaxID=933852 RepID=A0A0C3B6A6_SERVB|nr:hypothetical protein M408DRAFT_162605 [Serendipita vermifera MAFF 305830]
MSHLEQTIQELRPIIVRSRPRPSLYRVGPPGGFEDPRAASVHEQEQRELKSVQQIDAYSVYYWRSQAETPEKCLLLEQDRNYRRAVWDQQNAVDEPISWYRNYMPVGLSILGTNNKPDRLSLCWKTISSMPRTSSQGFKLC